MKKVVVPLLLTSLAGGVLYAILQATIPASRSAQERAAAMLKNIELVPAEGSVAQAQTSKAEDKPAAKPSQIEAQRNHYLNAAIESLQSETNKLVCARAAHYREVAAKQQQAIGASPEKVLLDELSKQNSDLLQTTVQRGGFNGEADSQETGRALTLDTLAILKALQDLYNNESKSCISESFQAGELVGSYLIRANQHRSVLQQQAAPTQEEVAKNEQN